MLVEKERRRQVGVLSYLRIIVTSKRWAIIVAMLLVVAAGVWAAVRATRPKGAAAVAAAVLHEVPAGEKLTLRFFRNPTAVTEVAMRDLDGRSISPATLRGKAVLVNFWATWCPPCRAEIPDLVALQAKYGDKVQIIGVSQDEGSVDVVKRFAAEQHMNYPIVMMTPELDRAFPGIAALPTSFVLDRESRLVQRHVGMLNATVTEQEMRALAGLPVSASIEEVERGQPARLENAAQATSIPGVDLARLSPERRMQALQKLNSEPCTCGCDNTVAKCRIDDPKCATSLPLAQRIVAEISEQP
jgi:cytochrome c biogenesis protein CcmG/thiol:disulfide interchange protein DsbE